MSSQEEKAILLVEDEAVFENVRSRENVRKNSDKSVASQYAPLSRVSIREGYMETREEYGENERSDLRILILGNMADEERLERQLRQAQKMEALNTLCGGVAHDFNNILAAIIGFTELVADHVEKGSLDEGHLRRVLEAGMRGRELVRQLLAFSQKTAQEKKPLLPSIIVEEAAKLLTATTPTTISVRVKTVSESGFILGDPAQIRQILVNLWTNAVYAMRDKGGVLDIEVSDFSVSLFSAVSENDHGMEAGLYMKLVVRDTGIGIEPAIIHRVFDPFFTTKKVGEGTGLGLSVVHGIVKQSNGYLTVESEPGRGSIFTVYLPARER